MQIQVNGRPMEAREGLTVAELLATLAVRPAFTAVALNREVVPRATHARTVLRAGDRVEIVHPMAGG
jgi:sulfur carrier protein